MVAAWIGGLVCCVLAACAPPPPALPDQIGSVPSLEIRAAALAQEGSTLYKASRFADAEARFRQALYLYPKADNIVLNLALTLSALDNDSDAIVLLQKLMRENPKNYRYLVESGAVLYHARRFAEARASFERALDLALETGSSEIALRAARALSALAFRIGDEQSAQCYSDLVRSLASGVDEGVRHVKLLTGLGLAPEARNVLEVLANDRSVDQNLPYLLNRAVVELALGNTKEAEQAADSALSLVAADSLPPLELLLVKGVDFSIRSYQERHAEELSSAEAAAALTVSFNEQALLYWPVPLLERFGELRGSR